MEFHHAAGNFAGDAFSINVKSRLRGGFIQPSDGHMSDRVLTDAIDRAERALSRLEQAASRIDTGRGREEKLRATVRDVVAELDSIFAAGDR